MNNKMKSRNNIDNEKEKKADKNNIIYSQKKKSVMSNKISNNKLNLDYKDSKTNNPDLNKNQNITTLTRNISFHDSNKIIYAPKKLITSSNLKSPQKKKKKKGKNISNGAHNNYKIKKIEKYLTKRKYGGNSEKNINENGFSR